MRKSETKTIGKVRVKITYKTNSKSKNNISKPEFISITQISSKTKIKRKTTNRNTIIANAYFVNKRKN